MRAPLFGAKMLVSQEDHFSVLPWVPAAGWRMDMHVLDSAKWAPWACSPAGIVGFNYVELHSKKAFIKVYSVHVIVFVSAAGKVLGRAAVPVMICKLPLSSATMKGGKHPARL